MYFCNHQYKLNIDSCEQANLQGPCIDFEQKDRVKVNGIAIFKIYRNNQYFSLGFLENKG